MPPKAASEAVVAGESNADCATLSACATPPAEDKAVGSGIHAARQLRPSAETAACETSAGGEMETCPICLDPLWSQQLGVCLDQLGRRTCGHFFHLRCLQRVEGAHCPQCRLRFFCRCPLPVLGPSWLGLAAPSRERREVVAGLKACLQLGADAVDRLVAEQWPNWTDGDRVTNETFPRLQAAVAGYLPTWNCEGSKDGWEEEEDAKPATAQGGDLRCACGKMHLRRGDRLRRGPGLCSVDAEDPNVVAGQLGSVVRLLDGHAKVLVKWDRSAKAHCYAWPDATDAVLKPAHFSAVAADVRELLSLTVRPPLGPGLSSAAAEELLARVGHLPPGSVPLKELAKRGLELGEECLRRPPQLFHRVRLLPDRRVVQQWFDKSRPCQCNRPGCCGGVMWSSRAEKHLGREAVVLQIDPSDDTVLVETSGPCDCKIWYPRLAVMPAYDPDLEDEPQFHVDDHVECKMQTGWERGVVKEVLWRGQTRCGPVPYTVTLGNGSSIFVPHVNLIRRADGHPARK